MSSSSSRLKRSRAIPSFMGVLPSLAPNGHFSKLGFGGDFLLGGVLLSFVIVIQGAILINSLLQVHDWGYWVKTGVDFALKNAGVSVIPWRE